MTKNFYRILGADESAIIMATRTGSITMIEGTPQALTYLKLEQESLIIDNPSPKAKAKTFRRIDDFTKAFTVELEALTDDFSHLFRPTNALVDFSDIPEPADGELVSPLQPDNDDGIASQPSLEPIEEPIVEEELADWSEEPISEDEDDTDHFLLESSTEPVAEPTADEPVVDEPVVDEPVVDEPVVDEEPIEESLQMSFIELRRFQKDESARLGRNAAILATGLIVKGKELVGNRKVWLNTPAPIENALVTKIGNKWLFLLSDGQRLFAKETENMTYRSA